MKEYICKIASLDEIETKWNFEISNHKNNENWIIWKNEAIERFTNGQSITYYGVLNGKIISEATAMFENAIVQNSENLVDENTAYLCAFRTVKKHQEKGCFSKLFRFMIDDLKDRGYTKVTLGVEPSDKKNLAIYQKYGFSEYIKSAQEKYPDGTIIDVDYYGKSL